MEHVAQLTTITTTNNQNNQTSHNNNNNNNKQQTTNNNNHKQQKRRMAHILKNSVANSSAKAVALVKGPSNTLSRYTVWLVLGLDLGLGLGLGLGLIWMWMWMWMQVCKTWPQYWWSCWAIKLLPPNNPSPKMSLKHLIYWKKVSITITINPTTPTLNPVQLIWLNPPLLCLKGGEGVQSVSASTVLLMTILPKLLDVVQSEHGVSLIRYVNWHSWMHACIHPFISCHFTIFHLWGAS